MKGKQHKRLSFVGRFEPPGEPDAGLDGHVESTSRGIALQTTPSFSSPMNIKPLAILGGRAKEVHWEVMHGRTTEGLCSLLFVAHQNESQMANFPKDYAVDSDVFSINSVLSEIELSGLDKQVIVGARLEFGQLRHWLPQALEITKSGERTIVSASASTPSFVEFCSVIDKAKHQLEAETHFRLNAKRGAYFRSRVAVKLSFCPPVSYREFRQRELRVEDFFSLLMGVPIHATRVQLKVAGDVGNLFRSRERKRRKPYSPIWVNPDSKEIALAWSNWLALQDNLRPFEELLYGTVQQSRMFVETEFLSLVQALEAFHRLTRGGDLKAKDRVRELIARINPGRASKLLGDVEAFVISVVNTRDSLTHLGIKKDRIISGTKPLFLANQKMHALLRLLVLLHVGMSEDHAFQPCLAQANRYR